MRATKRKSAFRSRRRTKRGGRERSRSRTRSRSPRRSRSRTRSPIRLTDNNDPVGQDPPWNFSVSCNNGEQHTSDYMYSRIGARNAASAYCVRRGGINGHPTYMMRPPYRDPNRITE